MRKRFEFSGEEILQGKNLADIEGGYFSASYVEYDVETGEGIAYGTLYENETEEEETLCFNLYPQERERLLQEELTAGRIFNAGWEEYQI